jgi:hypothetical protein
MLVGEVEGWGVAQDPVRDAISKQLWTSNIWIHEMLTYWKHGELAAHLVAVRKLNSPVCKPEPNWHTGWFIVGIPAQFASEASALAHLKALEDALILALMTED